MRFLKVVQSGRLARRGGEMIVSVATKSSLKCAVYGEQATSVGRCGEGQAVVRGMSEGGYYLALPFAFGFMAPVDVILLVCMSSPM